jgi:hypothetical protein
MIKNLTVLAAVAMALSGCPTPPVNPRPGGDPKQPGRTMETTELGFDAVQVAAPTPCRVNVHIVNDAITIDHEPVQSKGCDERGGFAVRWKLREGSEYTFPGNGIAFKTSMPPGLNCRSTGPKVILCTGSARDDQSYLYTITVLKNGAPWKSLDPTFVNN